MAGKLSNLSPKDNEIICLRHFKSIECDPEKLILRYRYTLDELATLLGGLKARKGGEKRNLSKTQFVRVTRSMMSEDK
jgi:hypothetical protein